MELENIDDDCDQNDIAFVKIDDDNEAAEWGIDEIPTIVSVPLLCFYENVYFRVDVCLKLRVKIHLKWTFHLTNYTENKIN